MIKAKYNEESGTVDVEMTKNAFDLEHEFAAITKAMYRHINTILDGHEGVTDEGTIHAMVANAVAAAREELQVR